jgi:hypothetical protein
VLELMMKTPRPFITTSIRLSRDALYCGYYLMTDVTPTALSLKSSWMFRPLDNFFASLTRGYR